MKLFCRILIVFMILSSCSNNENSNVETTTIVGVWKPVKYVEVCSAGNEDIRNFDTCEQRGRATFTQNGIYNETTYFLTNTNECILDIENNGSWEINNDIITITDNQGVVYEQTFLEISENVLKIGEYDVDSNYNCGNGDAVSHNYLEYIRVE